MTSYFTNVRMKPGLVDHRPMVTLSYSSVIILPQDYLAYQVFILLRTM